MLILTPKQRMSIRIQLKARIPVLRDLHSRLIETEQPTAAREIRDDLKGLILNIKLLRQ